MGYCLSPGLCYWVGLRLRKNGYCDIMGRGAGDNQHMYPGILAASLPPSRCNFPQLLPQSYLRQLQSAPPSLGGNGQEQKSVHQHFIRKGFVFKRLRLSLADRSPMASYCVGDFSQLWLSGPGCLAWGPGLSPFRGSSPHPWSVASGNWANPS